MSNYSPLWASLFQDEFKRLTSALGARAQDIQHIGSTAVPGLAAKPILDIGVAVADEPAVIACIPLLGPLGYTYRGDRGPQQGHFFDKGPEEQLTHYLHLLLLSSPAWHDYLHFRDYLIAHPMARDAYLQLKRELAKQFATDRAAYTAAKAQFIQGILTAAQ